MLAARNCRAGDRVACRGADARVGRTGLREHQRGPRAPGLGGHRRLSSSRTPAACTRRGRWGCCLRQRRRRRRAFPGPTRRRRRRASTRGAGSGSPATSRSFTVTFFGGPTMISLQQDLVADVEFPAGVPLRDRLLRKGHRRRPVGDGHRVQRGRRPRVLLLGRCRRRVRSLQPGDGRSGLGRGGTVGVPAGGLQVGGGLRLEF